MTDTRERDRRPASIRAQRRLEWIDTDASGHWHHAAALRLIEWAETVLLDRLGILEEIYGCGIPRVHVEVDFRKPIRFYELADVFLEIVDVGRSSLSYRAEITRGGELCAEGSFVAVLRGPEGTPLPWPDEQRERLLTAGAQSPLLLE